jgi:hypothetical protein
MTFIALLWRLHPGPPEVITTATLMAPVSSGTLNADETLTALGLLPRRGDLNNINTHIALLTNPALIKQAVERLNPQETARGWANQQAAVTSIVARSPDSSNLLEISAKAYDAQAAGDLVKTLIGVYAERLDALVSAQQSQTLQTVNQKLAEVRDQMRQVHPGTNANAAGAHAPGSMASSINRTPGNEMSAPASLAALQNVEQKLRAYAVVLNLARQQNATSAPEKTPAIITLATTPDPTARTWTRALLTSALCAFMLTVLVVVWLEQSQMPAAAKTDES